MVCFHVWYPTYHGSLPSHKTGMDNGPSNQEPPDISSLISLMPACRVIALTASVSGALAYSCVVQHSVTPSPDTRQTNRGTSEPRVLAGAKGLMRSICNIAAEWPRRRGGAAASARNNRRCLSRMDAGTSGALSRTGSCCSRRDSAFD